MKLENSLLFNEFLTAGVSWYREYLINASSKEERDEWIEALRKATPLPGKNWVRRTTALKAALVLSSQKSKEERGTIDDQMEFDEEVHETNLDNILVPEECVSAGEKGGADDIQVLSNKDDVELAPDKSEASPSTSVEELPPVTVRVLEASLSPTRLGKEDSLTNYNEESVVEVEIDVSGSGSSEVSSARRNSSDNNNNNSSMPCAVDPHKESCELQFR